MQASALKQREEDYRRLNDELEKKTSALVAEADRVLRQHEALLSSAPADIEQFPALSSSVANEVSSRLLLQIDSADLEDLESGRATNSKPTTGILRHEGAANLPAASQLHNRSSGVIAPHSAPTLTPRTAAAHSARAHESEIDDALPGAAAQMGVEAQLRFLKAKVRVLQTEFDRLQMDMNSRCQEVTDLNSKLRESEDDRTRLSKQISMLQQALAKQKKVAEEKESQATTIERQAEVFKRDCDSARREAKKVTSDKSAAEVRLNRALEEAQQLRQELSKARASVKDASGEERKRAEKLAGDVRKLERQRTELIAIFKKSMRLVEILRRQKLHLEAAKLLQFREEEFVHALEWDKQGPTMVQPSYPSGAVSATSRMNGRPPTGPDIAPARKTSTVKSSSSGVSGRQGQRQGPPSQISSDDGESSNCDPTGGLSIGGRAYVATSNTHDSNDA